MTRIIKKYPNRRLYDTKLGVYITLEDVKNLVVNREDFQVIDARSKKDLTQSTLLQIITEQESSSTPIFTTALLQDLIRFYNEKSQSVLSKYLEQAMELFMQQKDFYQNQWGAYQQLLSNPNLMEQVMQMQKMWAMSASGEEKKEEGKSKKE